MKALSPEREPTARQEIGADKGSAPPTAPATPSRPAFVLAFTAIYLIWGSTYLCIRVAIETMPPFLMAGARFIIAGTLVFTFLKLRGATWPTWPQWRANAVIGTFLLLGGNGLVVWAELTIPSGITALLIGVGPLFIVLTEWAWPGGIRPTLTTMVALLIGFAGVSWLAAPWEQAAGVRLNPAGVVAILGACCSWGIGAIYSRHARHGAPPMSSAALQMLAGGGALLFAAILRGEHTHFDVSVISLRSWGAFAYLVAAGSIVAFSTFVWLLKHSTPARVATYNYVNPIVAVILGWLILGEPITVRTVAASAIIIAAVAIVTTEKSRVSVAKARP